MSFSAQVSSPGSGLSLYEEIGGSLWRRFQHESLFLPVQFSDSVIVWSTTFSSAHDETSFCFHTFTGVVKPTGLSAPRAYICVCLCVF